MKPVVKFVVGFSALCAVGCFAAAVYCIIKPEPIWAIILWSVLGVLGLLPILPAKNRRIRFEEDTFTYRTWLGNEYRFRYADVLWYRVTDHDLFMYTAKKRLIVDRDVEDAEPMRKHLVAHGIPNRKPTDTAGISDDAGEVPQAVYYRSQRGLVTVVMLSLTALPIVLLVLMTLFVPVRTAADRRWMVVLYLLAGAAMLYFVGMALFSWNGRVECYRTHFIYRTWLGARRDYAYSDCVSKKEKNYWNWMNANNRIYQAKICMKDGSRIRLDSHILEDGFGAFIKDQDLPKD